MNINFLEKEVDRVLEDSWTLYKNIDVKNLHNFVMEKDGVKIYKEDREGMPGIIYGYGTIKNEHHPSKIWELTIMPTDKMVMPIEINPLLTNRQILQTFSNNNNNNMNKIILRETYTSGVFLVSDRVFYVATEIKDLGNGEFAIVKGSMESAKADGNFVLAKMKSVLHFIPIMKTISKDDDHGDDDDDDNDNVKKNQNNSVIDSYQTFCMGNTDFGGYIPQWLVDRSSLEIPMSIITLPNFLSKQKYTKQF